MSERTEQVTEAVDLEPVLERLRQWYHVPVLAALFTFMLWIRVRKWENFVVDGQVLFAGNDAWYHFRMVQYTANNWPWTMPFDPWTHFPKGTSVGQFGTLYDQIVATVALLVGLGSPTEHQIALTLLFAPAVFGALTVVPAYYLGKRLGGRAGGIVGTLVVALTPGQFLTRSLVGFADHHVAETLFHATAIVLVFAALDVAQREKPVWELFEAREFEALKRPLGWAALAGVALGLYMWVWPPGVFLVGVLAVAFGVAMAYHYARGVSPDHVAISGATTMVVAALMMVVHLNRFTINTVEFTLLQPLLALLVALGCVFMAWFARFWDDRDLPRLYYPGAVAGIAMVGLGVFAVALPDQFDYFLSQFLRIFGYQSTAASRTVAEAQPIPLGRVPGFLYNSYGLAFYSALAGFLVLALAVAQSSRPRAVYVVALVWSVFLFMATLTQRRFDYYLVLPVAGLNAYVASQVFGLVDLDEVSDSLGNVELYQVMTVLTVVMLVAAPLVVASGNVYAVSGQSSQPGSVRFWDGSLNWMQENTPEEGAYGTGKTTGHLDYYGTYQYTEDFDYQDGEYGVMAWWDYGHWITTLGHRVPVANPFQQGAGEAAEYLLATNETRANRMLRNDEGEETRYVIVDYPLGVASSTKFSAPTAFTGGEKLTSRDVAIPIYDPQSGRAVVVAHTNRSYHSMRVRLYQFHGSAASPRIGNQYVVLDWECTEFQGTHFALTPQQGRTIRTYPNKTAATEYIARDGPDGCPESLTANGGASSQLGGLPGIPTERIEALDHYRLVHVSEQSRRTRTGSLQWVKTFERVPGATVQGEGPANTTVVARVRMRMTNVNKTFTYTQRVNTGPDGEFTMTLPYSTTGYENWGPAKGYTNVSVRATGPYRFSAPSTTNINTTSGEITSYRATANVSEAKVIGESEAPVTVTLEKQVVGKIAQGSGNSTSSSLAAPDAAYARPA